MVNTSVHGNPERAPTLEPGRMLGGKWVIVSQIGSGGMAEVYRARQPNLNRDVAVKIARGELSAICRAVGVMQPRDSVELHNLPLLITVKLKKREDTGELTNEIKGYAPKDAANGQQPQAPATDNTPPWKR